MLKQNLMMIFYKTLIKKLHKITEKVDLKYFQYKGTFWCLQYGKVAKFQVYENRACHIMLETRGLFVVSYVQVNYRAILMSYQLVIEISACLFCVNIKIDALSYMKKFLTNLKYFYENTIFEVSWTNHMKHFPKSFLQIIF